MNQPRVSIILLNWNAFKDTTECLESLKKISYQNYRVIVVDQASKENEADRLEEKFGDFVEIIRNKQNVGFPEGCNIGIRYAIEQGTDYVYLLNNDTVVEPNFLESLVELMEVNRRIGAAQSKLRYFYQKNYFDYSGAAGGFIDIFGYPFARGRVFYSHEEDFGQYDKISPIFWACGAAVLIRCGVLKKIGLFDPIYFAYFDETDLCWRIWANGFLIISVPSSVIYHKVAVSNKRNLLKKSYFEHRNNIIMLLKNYALPDLFLFLPARFILDGVSLFYYLLTGRFKNFLALLGAYGWLLTHFPVILGRRTKIKHMGLTRHPCVYKGSVAWQYFLRGKRKYSEIMKPVKKFLISDEVEK